MKRSTERNEAVVNVFPLRNLHIEDAFWSEYIRLIREVVLPYQWRVLNDQIEGVEPSHAIQNFKIVVGMAQGEFYGMVFQDSDVAKWLEAASYMLETNPDPDLEGKVDEVIEIIAKAQHEDGYLNTYFTLKEAGKQWSNLAECHELYCAGHMIEAAVAHYRATGKRKLLDVACRLADCIHSVFGPEPGKIAGYDGHQEIELALVKLYRVTGDEKYMRLSRFFLDERGKDPSFYELEFEKRGTHYFPELNMVFDRTYSQAHLPVRQQTAAEGHAVRAVYMYSAMADVAAETKDAEMLEACRSLWKSITTRRMYITGGIGSMAHGESFTLDYDLPGDTAYAETCASIGLIFFAHRMLKIEAKSEYADVLEQALYNNVLSGISRDGRKFFYVNPLEIWPAASGKNKNLDHVKIERQSWFGCACCPPNIARLLASLGQYVYTVKDQTIYMHLYIGGHAEMELDGTQVRLRQQSQLPWEGNVRLEIDVDNEADLALAVRIPNWCKSAKILVNRTSVEPKDTIVDGYVHIRRTWRAGDTVELRFPMPVNRMKSHPMVRETFEKVALQRGPLVYCLEEADNGPNLHHILLEPQSEPVVQFDGELLGGIQTIGVPAFRADPKDWGELLYKVDGNYPVRSVTARFIPYFAWANRGRGEMTVWVRERESRP